MENDRLSLMVVELSERGTPLPQIPSGITNTTTTKTKNMPKIEFLTAQKLGFHQ